MLSHGLTGVHDAALSPSDVEFFTLLDQGKVLPGENRRRTAKGQSRLPMRLYGMVGCEPTNAWCGDGIERYEGERFTVRCVPFSLPVFVARSIFALDAMIRVREVFADLVRLSSAAKIFTDGALGSWGAAMHEPYSDAPDKTGILISPAEAIQPLVERWVAKVCRFLRRFLLPSSLLLRRASPFSPPRRLCSAPFPSFSPLLFTPDRNRTHCTSTSQGFQVNSHGIGDRANTVVLDAYEAVLRNLTAQRLRKAEGAVTEAEMRVTQKTVRLRNEHTQILVRCFSISSPPLCPFPPKLLLLRC